MIWTRLDTNILSSQSTNLEYDVISNIVSLLKRAFIKINLSKCSYVNCVEWMRYIRSLSFPVIKTFGVTDWKKRCWEILKRRNMLCNIYIRNVPIFCRDKHTQFSFEFEMRFQDMAYKWFYLKWHFEDWKLTQKLYLKIKPVFIAKIELNSNNHKISHRTSPECLSCESSFVGALT